MIIRKNGFIETNSEYPDTDWTGDAEYIISDNDELSNKILEALPKFELIFDGNGKIIDVKKLISEDILKSKINEIKETCENVIINGTDIEVIDKGVLHFSLSKTKQEDLKTLFLSVKSGATNVLWHDDSRVTHEVYTSIQFEGLYSKLMYFVVQCKLKSDWLEQLAVDFYNDSNIDGLNNINWETTLPNNYQLNIQEQITVMLGNFQ